MSVDDRLREAFGETDRSWDEQVPDALAAVTARRRHESVVRRGAAAALVAAAAVGRRRSSPHADDGRESPTPPLTTALCHPHGCRYAERSPRRDLDLRPITGRGRPGRGPRRRTTRRRRGRCWTCCLRRPFRVVLLVTGDRPEPGLPLGPRGETSADDVETILIEGSRIFLRPLNAPGGVNVHTWVLEDGVLRLTFVSTTEADTDGRARRGLATTAVRHRGLHAGR